MKFLLALCAATCIVGVYSIDIADLIPDIFPILIPKNAISKCTTTNKLDEAIIDEVITNKSFSKTIGAQQLGSCLLESSGIVNGGKVHEFYMDSEFGRKCIIKVGGYDGKIESSAKIMSCLLQEGFVTMIE